MITRTFWAFGGLLVTIWEARCESLTAVGLGTCCFKPNALVVDL